MNSSGIRRARTYSSAHGARRLTAKLAFALVLAGAAAFAGCGLGGVAEPGLDSAHAPTSTQESTKTTVGVEQKVPLQATPHIVRLSSDDWERTMRDLLRLDVAPGSSMNFPPDPAPPDNEFGAEASNLIVLTTQWAAYQKAAEDLAALIADNPDDPTTVSPKLLKLWPDAAKGGDTAARVSAFVADFLPRAYRRDVTKDEIDAVIAAAEAGVGPTSGADPFLARVKMILTAVLQSPKLLYRISFGETEVKDGRARLTGYEVAQKLSYAMWGTMPDDELFADARSGKLSTPEGVAEVARRVVMDRRSERALVDFHDKLYLVDRYQGVNIRPAALFPNFYPEFSQDAQQDVRNTVRDLVIDHPGGLKDLQTSTTAYVNLRLAPIYGIDPTTLPQPKVGGATATSFVKVEMNPAERIGVLMHPGWLALEGTPRDPALIKRGAYIARHVLCAELGAPLPSAGNAKIDNAQPTNRKRVNATTGQCGAGCHTRIINPLGASLEGFDSLGQARTRDGNEPVDTAGDNDLIGKFDGGISLFKAASENEHAHACYAAHWGAYLNGTSVVDVTQTWLKKPVTQSLAGGSVRDLIIELVQTDAFLTVSR